MYNIYNYFYNSTLKTCFIKYIYFFIFPRKYYKTNLLIFFGVKRIDFVKLALALQVFQWITNCACDARFLKGLHLGLHCNYAMCNHHTHSFLKQLTVYILKIPSNIKYDSSNINMITATFGAAACINLIENFGILLV